MLTRLFFFALIAVALSPTSYGAELGVLAPVLVDGQAQQRPDSDGKPAPVVTRVTSGTLYEHLQREARNGFTATMIALDERVQRLAGNPKPRPTWLYLSQEDGGFPRFGFWLQDASGTHFVREAFVDLVVDEDTVDNGGFEEIFAHELGHVMLHRMVPDMPQGYSRTPHASFAITDRPTAFDEGFAIHFQSLARRYTRNERLRLEDDGIGVKPFLGYWWSNIDRNLRIEGVRRNLFVQAQLPLAGESNALALRDNSTLFDSAHLKSGDQMMASEGVVASVFYRWIVPGEGSSAAIVDRYARLFTAFGALGKTALEPDTPFLVRTVQRYAELNPLDKGNAIRVFVETTYGSTVDPALARQTEALAAVGRVNDMDGFVGQLKSARAALTKLVDDTMRKPDMLDAALSQPIWLYADAPAGSKTYAPAFDLNVAERESLLALPGIDAASADRIVAERRAHGAYASLDAVASRAGFAPEVAATLTTLHAGAQRAGTNSRR